MGESVNSCLVEETIIQANDDEGSGGPQDTLVCEAETKLAVNESDNLPSPHLKPSPHEEPLLLMTMLLRPSGERSFMWRD